MATTGTATTPLLYDGQDDDQVTGFYYLQARWYDPVTSELTGVDPDVAETGQPYVYAGDDPVNEGDPSGLYAYTMDHDLGPVSLLGGAAYVMSVLKNNFMPIFPFPITGCTSLRDRAVCELHVIPCWVPGAHGCGIVMVQNVTATSFSFKVIKKGYFDPVGSVVTFNTYVASNSKPSPAWASAPDPATDVYLQQVGYAPKNHGLENTIAPFVARDTWEQQASNLANFAFAAHNPGKDPLTWGYGYPPSPTPPAPIFAPLQPSGPTVCG